MTQNSYAKLIISSLDQVEHHYKTKNPQAVISIGNSEDRCPDFPELNPKKYLRLVFNDVEHLHPQGPNENIVKTIIEFGKSLDSNDTLLVHCQAGISRSTAAGLICQISRFGIDSLRSTKYDIINTSKFCSPNLLMCYYADTLMNLSETLMNTSIHLSSRALIGMNFDIDHSKEEFYKKTGLPKISAKI